MSADLTFNIGPSTSSQKSIEKLVDALKKLKEGAGLTDAEIRKAVKGFEQLSKYVESVEGKLSKAVGENKKYKESLKTVKKELDILTKEHTKLQNKFDKTSEASSRAAEKIKAYGLSVAELVAGEKAYGRMLDQQKAKLIERSALVDSLLKKTGGRSMKSRYTETAALEVLESKVTQELQKQAAVKAKLMAYSGTKEQQRLVENARLAKQQTIEMERQLTVLQTKEKYQMKQSALMKRLNLDTKGLSAHYAKANAELKKMVMSSKEIARAQMARSAVGTAGMSVTGWLGMAKAQKDIAKAQSKVKQSTEAVNSGFKKQSALMFNLRGAIRGLVGSFGKLWFAYGAMVPMIATFAGASLVKGVYNLGSSLEYTATHIAAIANATQKAIVQGDEFSVTVGMIEKGLLAVTNTMFSPQELSEGLLLMVKAGYDVSASLENMGNMAKFATVTGVEMSKATELVVTQMRAWGEEVVGSERGLQSLQQAQDIMAATMLSTKTSMNELGQALSMTTELASMSGVSFIELNATLGKLADVGLQGTKGAQALRTSIIRLQAPTGKAKDMMKELGIQLDVFDEAGRFKGLVNMFDELQDKTKYLTDKNRTELFKEIFGLRAMKGGANVARMFAQEVSKGTWSLKELAGRLREVEADGTIVTDMYEELAKTGKGTWTILAQDFKRFITSLYDSELVVGMLNKLRDAIADERFKKGIESLVRLGDMFVSALISVVSSGKLLSFFENLGRAVLGIATLLSDVIGLLISFNDWQNKAGDGKGLSVLKEFSRFAVNPTWYISGAVFSSLLKGGWVSELSSHVDKGIFTVQKLGAEAESAAKKTKEAVSAATSKGGKTEATPYTEQLLQSIQTQRDMMKSSLEGIKSSYDSVGKAAEEAFKDSLKAQTTSVEAQLALIDYYTASAGEKYRNNFVGEWVDASETGSDKLLSNYVQHYNRRAEIQKKALEESRIAASYNREIMMKDVQRADGKWTRIYRYRTQAEIDARKEANRLITSDYEDTLRKQQEAFSAYQRAQMSALSGYTTQYGDQISRIMGALNSAATGDLKLDDTAVNQLLGQLRTVAQESITVYKERAKAAQGMIDSIIQKEQQLIDKVKGYQQDGMNAAKKASDLRFGLYKEVMTDEQKYYAIRKRSYDYFLKAEAMFAAAQKASGTNRDELYQKAKGYAEEALSLSQQLDATEKSHIGKYQERLDKHKAINKYENLMRKNASAMKSDTERELEIFEGMRKALQEMADNWAKIVESSSKFDVGKDINANNYKEQMGELINANNEFQKTRDAINKSDTTVKASGLNEAIQGYVKQLDDGTWVNAFKEQAEDIAQAKSQVDNLKSSTEDWGSIWIKYAKEEKEARGEVVTLSEDELEIKNRLAILAEEAGRMQHEIDAKIKSDLEEQLKLLQQINLERSKGVATNVGGVSGARAQGGPVLAGKTYLVGEKGPELFSPVNSGHIIPNDKLGTGMMNVNISIDGSEPIPVMATKSSAQMLKDLEKRAKRAA